MNNKGDLRIAKTFKSLSESFPKLLTDHKFSKLTVNDICNEAQISRATFYSHFRDKYDLLENWLGNQREIIRGTDYSYESVMPIVNSFVNNNRKIIKNVLTEMSDETRRIMLNFMVSLLPNAKNEASTQAAKHRVFVNFCAGGMLNYLIWHKENYFPGDEQAMNRYYYDILYMLQNWMDLETEQ